MLQQSNESNRHMALGQLFSITVAAGTVLRSRGASLWLTEAGGGDVMLAAGQSYRVRQSGRLVIEGLSAGRYSLQMAAATPWQSWLAAGRRHLQQLVNTSTASVAKPCDCSGA